MSIHDREPSVSRRNQRALSLKVTRIAGGTGVFLILLGVPSVLWAQGPNPQPGSEQLQTPALLITSRPAGATVFLKGPYEMVGQTPWTLYRELSGIYQVEARHPGYESWKGEVVLGGGGDRTLEIELSRKTRWKAAGRSLLIPGWGQGYAGSASKGRLFFLAGVAAMGGVLVTHLDYRNQVEDFDRAADAYRSATRTEDLPILRRALLEAEEDAEAAYDRRNTFLYVTAGVYGLSFLDALLFSPGGDGSDSAQGPERPDGDTTGPLLGWSASINPEALLRLGVTIRTD